MAKYIIRKSTHRVSNIYKGGKWYSHEKTEIISEPINGLQNAKNILSNLWLDFFNQKLVTFESQPLGEHDWFFSVYTKTGYDIYSVVKANLYI